MTVLALSPESLRPDIDTALRYGEPDLSGPREAYVELDLPANKQVGPQILAGEFLLTRFVSTVPELGEVRSVRIAQADPITRFLTENGIERDGLNWLTTPGDDIYGEMLRSYALHYGPDSAETTQALMHLLDRLPDGAITKLAYAAQAERRLSELVGSLSEQDLRKIPKQQLATLFDYFPRMTGERLAAFARPEAAAEAVRSAAEDYTFITASESSVAGMYDALRDLQDETEQLAPAEDPARVAQEFWDGSEGRARKMFGKAAASLKRLPKSESKTSRPVGFRRRAIGLAASTVALSAGLIFATQTPAGNHENARIAATDSGNAGADYSAYFESSPSALRSHRIISLARTAFSSPDTAKRRAMLCARPNPHRG